MKTVRERNTVYELLRVLAMLMIITWHATVHGGITASQGENGSVYYALLFLQTITVPATNLFVLLSGYYLIQSSFNVKRFVFLWIKVVYYSLVLYVATLACRVVPCVNKIDLVRACFPITFGKGYWFIKTYLGLYVLSPFINIALVRMSVRMYRSLLVVLLFLFAFVTSIPGANTLNSEGQHSILWFVVLYCSGAYIRKYNVSLRIKYSILGIVASYSFLFLSLVFLPFISEVIGFGGRGTGLFMSYNTIPVYSAAIFIFLLFTNIARNDIQRPLIKRIVMFLSGSSFSVYLIHEHIFLRPYLWALMDLSRFKEARFFGLIIIAVCMLIYIACVAVDCVTWKPFSKVFNRIDFSGPQDRMNSLFSN